MYRPLKQFTNYRASYDRMRQIVFRFGDRDIAVCRHAVTLQR